MKIDSRKVSRTIKGVSGDETVEKTVEFAVAESEADMLEASGNDLKKVLYFFNTGRWSDIRAKISNELAGGKPEDKAFAKVLKAVSGLAMFAGKSEDEIRAALTANPALMALFGGTPEPEAAPESTESVEA